MGLNAGDVICVELQVGHVAPVEGRHHRRVNVGVAQAQVVAELVDCYPEQINTCKTEKI
jgi:hypothetical protein